MRSAGLRLLLVLACLFVGWALTIDIDDSEIEELRASNLLKMIPAGKPGSCADMPVDRALQEAAMLAKNAANAIEKLMENYKIENNDENERLLNMAYISFGVKYKVYDNCDDPELDPKKPMPLVITEGKDRLDTANRKSYLSCTKV